MLQQTQVERVVPKYRQFLEHYPTLEALAHARPAAVRKLWYPLGYNVRPLHLHAIAREAVARYGGRLPEDGEALARLPGVGRYTAGALLSFAFGRDAPLVDTNVRRVLGRIFLGPGRLRRLRNDKSLWALSAAVLPPGRAYDWNQALMDFGATWCTARAPRCARCPMRTFCASYPVATPGPAPRARRLRDAMSGGSGSTRRRSPGRRPAVSAEPLDVVAAVIERGGQILITRRPRGSHLEGLWEFPGGKPHPGESNAAALRREIAEELGVAATVGDHIETVAWSYPDRRVRLTFYRCTVEGEPRPLEGQEMAWVAPTDLRRYPFPPADARLLGRLEGTAYAPSGERRPPADNG